MSSRSRRLQKTLPIAPSSLAGVDRDSLNSRDKLAAGEGAAAPFRSIGALVAEMPPLGGRKTDCRRLDAASPSGLLTRRAWEAELTDLYGALPSWYESGLECDRQFAHWVQAEAKELAMRLERLLGNDTESTLARQMLAVAEALWADADWARRRVDGSLDD